MKARIDRKLGGLLPWGVLLLFLFACSGGGGVTVPEDTSVVEDIPYVVEDTSTSDEGSVEQSHEPVLAKIGNRIVAVGEKLVIVLSATDPDGDPLKFSLYGTIPADSTFDKELNTFTWIPLEAGLDLFITFLVTDGVYVDHETVEIKVVAEKVGHPPVLERISDRKVAVDQNLNIQLEATDPDGDILQFGIMGDAPANASINSTTGEFVWTVPTELDQSIVRITFQVSDGVYQDTMPVQFLVGDVGSPPEFVAAGPFQVQFGTQANFVLSASDPDGDLVTLNVQSGMPNDAAFDPGTGTFVWTPPESEVGRVVDLVFVASDGVFITYQTVEIAVIAAPPVTGCQDDSAERNDDFPQASDLAPGTYQFNICDTAEVTDDWDIFRLSLTDGQTLEVIVTFDHLKSDIDIELFASDENEVLADSYDVGNVEQFTYVAQGDRIVYLLVYEIGEEGTASDYTLEVKVSNTPPVCQEDDLEEDDTFVQATPLNRPQETISGLIACPMDPDHFRISLNAHDSLTVTVTPAPGVLMAQIYAPDQATQLASVSMAVMTTNLVVTDVAQTGDYWVRVESFGRTPYTLGALVTPLQYKWVRIKDDPANQSLVNCYFNPGADIDSIELIRNGTGIGWATEVVATGLGTQCVKNTAADPAKVLGPMDELNYWDPNNLFLSLNSGEVVVAFGDGAGGLQDIRSGDQIRVTSWDHSGEAYSDVYHVTLCNDSACAVAIELGSNSGVATFDISY